MRKKILFACLLASIVTASFLVIGYAKTENITQQEIESPNTEANRKSIAKKVLADTGNSQRFTPEEVKKITIYGRDVFGDEAQEAVIELSISPSTSILAVYTPQKDGSYAFVANLGEFFDIQNVQFLPIKGLDDNILLVRENVNQNIGAFEKSSLIKGYLWNGKEFNQVLNLAENIDANWNDLWTGNTTDNQSRWRKIKERTDITYSDGATPKLQLIHNQQYAVSDDITNKNIPKEGTFTTQKDRIVTENLFWSPTWKTFILGEKMETRTKEPVAVLEDYGASPYALLEEYGAANQEKVRILRKDGSEDIISKSLLSDVEPSQPAAPTFFFEYPS